MTTRIPCLIVLLWYLTELTLRVGYRFTVRIEVSIWSFLIEADLRELFESPVDPLSGHQPCESNHEYDFFPISTVSDWNYPSN